MVGVEFCFLYTKNATRFGLDLQQLSLSGGIEISIGMTPSATNSTLDDSDSDLLADQSSSSAGFTDIASSETLDTTGKDYEEEPFKLDKDSNLVFVTKGRNAHFQIFNTSVKQNCSEAAPGSPPASQELTRCFITKNRATSSLSD